MLKYFLSKSISLVLTILVVSLLSFLILQVLPGDPALLILGMEASEASYELLREELNLDQPIFKRYLTWLKDFGQGRFGNSLRYSLRVEDLISQALPLTFKLALLGSLVALSLSLPLGVYLSTQANSKLAYFVSFLSQIGMSLPAFWLGLLLIQIFAVKLGILPAGGSETGLALVLPILTLALPRASVLIRQTKVGMATSLQQDYIKTARVMGLKESKVLYKYALKNGVLPMLTVLGFQFSQLFAGTIVVEQVFGLAGIGQLLLQGVLQRDLPLVQGVVVLVIGLILVFNFLFDLALGFLDPRLRYN